MSHTPGPWRYSINTKRTAFYVMAEKPRFVLETSWNNMEQDNYPDRETAEANARIGHCRPGYVGTVERTRGNFRRADLR